MPNRGSDDEVPGCVGGSGVSTRHDPLPVAKPTRRIFSHGVETRSDARTLRIAGQIGVDAEGRLAEGFRNQCRQAITNLEIVLDAAGMGRCDLVRMNVYLARKQDMVALVEILEERLDGVRSAVTTVLVGGFLSDDWLVEIEAVACAA